MISSQILELTQAEGEEGENSFEFLVTFYASFAQKNPNYREMQASFVLS